MKRKVKKISGISVQDQIEAAKELIATDTSLSPSAKAIVEMLILLISIFFDRLNVNSSNSSNPPSSDKPKEKEPKEKTGKKPGGQKGHVGSTLEPVKNPDEIIDLKVDRRTLSKGDYINDGFEARQIIDIVISKKITEYRAEILLNKKTGDRYVAEFPKHLTRNIQYGNSVKAAAVYFSQVQMTPYERTAKILEEQLKTPLSKGSIFNFCQEALLRLVLFEEIIKFTLLRQPALNADETGINIKSKIHWLHIVSNDKYTLIIPHKKRGKEAPDSIGILNKYTGILIHDCWKPYFSYSCEHGLCNAHILRELKRAEENDSQKWAFKFSKFLLETKKQVDMNGGMLTEEEYKNASKKYKEILNQANIECPEPERPPDKKGRVKKSPSRNLLERLLKYEDAILLFAKNSLVPFTNNQAENDIRMTKVQQKISGCFMSMSGAKAFCRIRSYIITCRKNNVSAFDAINLLFSGEMPPFLKELEKEYNKKQTL